MMSREIRDQQLFDEIAASYAQKDVAASSAAARAYRVQCAVDTVLAERDDLGVLVDMGCGVGAPAKFLYGRYQKYIGVDQSAELIAAAKTFTQELDNVEFIAGNAKETTLPDNVADVVLIVGALHHMTEMDVVLQEMRRIAKPGAYFTVIEPQNGNPFIQGMRWLRARMDGSYSEEQIYFAEAELTELFTRNGLHNLQVRYYGFASTPFAQVVMNPQAITTPLSKATVKMDGWMARHLPRPLQKFSFDIAVTGNFDE